MYEFESDGDRVIIEFRIGDAPPIGEKRVINGREWRRIPSSPQICGAHAGSTQWPSFESPTQPRWWKHHKGDFAPDGKPRFQTRAEVDWALDGERNDGTEIAFGET